MRERWALRLASHGHRVFPVWGVEVRDGVAIDVRTGEEATHSAKSGKRPMVAWKDWATTDAETISAWARDNPACNWGVVLGEGLVVLDADSDEAADLFEETVLSEGMEEVLETLTVKTTRGYHYYFHGDSRTYKPTVDSDVKGRGGYVVLPGSVSYTGQEYAVVKDSDMSEAPGFMCQAVAPRVVSGEDREPLRLGEGERSSGLTRIMGAVRRLNLPDETMRSVLREVNQSVCVPPLSEEELRETIDRSMARWEPGSDVEDALVWDRLFGQDVTEERKFFQTRQDRMQRPAPRWILERLLPETGIAQIYGKSYTGKSFVAIDLALTLCNEHDEWMGHPRVPRVGVSDYGREEPRDHALYVLGEGSFDFSQRVRSWCSRWGGSDEHLITVEEEEVDLSDSAGWAAMLSRMAEYPEIAAVRHRLNLVVLDTQSLLLGRVDENSNSEMTRAMRAAKMASRAMRCPVLFVHHEAKSDLAASGRGAGAVEAAMDLVMRVRQGSGETRLLETKKVKAAAIGATTTKLVIKPWEDSAVIELDRSVGGRGAEARAMIEEHGPQRFADLRTHFGVDKSDGYGRNALKDDLRRAGLEETGQELARSPLWDLSSQ